MSILINERYADGNSSFKFNISKVNIAESVNNPHYKNIDPNSLIVEIEAVHAYPFSTRNRTRYMKKALKECVSSWTKPYLKPVILHHNEDDGKIIGRVLAAEYVEKGTLLNAPALKLTVNIPDKEAIEQIKNGILTTTSIGVSSSDCRCSICGQNIAEEGECEHEKGLVYNGEMCYWDVYEMEAKEISYVIVPSDIYSQNIKVYSANKTNKKDIKESCGKGEFNMNEEAVKGVNVAEATNQEPENQIDYKAEYEKLKAENEELKNKEANKADNKEELTKSLNDTRVLLDQVQKSLKDAQDKLVLKEAEVIRETKLRESLEADLEAKNLELKESLLNNVLILRKALNKPQALKESFSNRTNESLKDTIKDLKEEMHIESNVGQKDLTEKTVNAAGKALKEGVENPGLVKEKNKKTVKEENCDSNMNLEESLESILNNFLQ